MATAYAPTIDDVIIVAVIDHAGAELAEDLIARGHRVAVAGSFATQLVPIVNGHVDRTLAIVADLTDPAQVRSMLNRVESRLGPVTVMTDPSGAFGSTPWRLHSIDTAAVQSAAVHRAAA